MKLIELKSEKFTYINKTYVQKRFISNDLEFLFTTDDLNYVKVYKANKEGKGEFVYDVYHQGNMYSYPIYTIEEAIKILKEKKISTSEKLYKFLLNHTHIK